MGKTKRVLVAALLSTVFASLGCVKKRSEIDAQGAYLGELTPVSTVKSWKHSIKTADKEPFLGLVTFAEQLRVDSDLDGIKFSGVIHFTSDESPFLNRVAADRLTTFGERNKTYPIEYRFTPKYLMVLKRIPLKDASIQERQTQLPSSYGSEILVPLGAWPVSYYTVELERNSNNRNTNVRRKFAIDPANYNSASFFKTDGEYIPFDVNLKDLLPAKYFTEGQWYYAKAIVSTKPGDEGAIGYFEGGISTAFEFANKIRFRQHQGYLRGVNVAVAEQKKRVQKKEGEAEDDVIAIPVQWVDFELGETEKESYEPKVILNNLTKETERPFGLFDFVNTGTLAPKTVTEALASRVIKDVVLDDLHITQDSFSFTLAKVATGEKTRYAFKRVKPSTYKPLVYRKVENDTFGAFYTTKPYVVTSRDDRKGDVEANILINRFDPEKPIVFRFSKDTPRIDSEKPKTPGQLNIDYREIGRRCVKYWNRAFEVAGTKVKVLLTEDQDGEVGDISSNIINIIDTLNESGLAGVGPSLADPETGEIVAGAANVYVAAYRGGISNRLRNYIRVRSGLARDYAFSKEIQRERELMAYTAAEVEHYCPDLRDFAISLKGRPQYSSERENVFIDRCLEKLLPRVLSEVTCHEMGHVFALRHNFECSADRANAYKDITHMKKVYPEKDFPEVYREFYPKTAFFPQSSCLMDYMPDDRPMLMVPGLYDIAALAFIYGGKVEKAGTRDKSPTGFGELIPIDRNIPLTEQAQYKASQKYAFCDDYEAGTSTMLPINPMCMRHDYGNTPIGLMNHYFDAFRDYIVLNFRKWDRDSAIESTKPMYFLENLTSVYKLWRAYLYDFVGKDKAHLQDVHDDDAYAKLKADLDQKFRHRDFLGVNELYAKFMTSIVDVPDLFCVAVRGEPGKGRINRNTDVRLVNFQTVFSEMVSSGLTEKVEGCSDPLLAKFVTDKYGKEWAIQGEIGYPTDNVKFSKSKDDKWEGADIIGLKEIRKDAMVKLTGALGSDRVYELKVRGNFSPRALDEPFIHNMMRDSVEQRLFEGLDVSGPVSELLESRGFNVDDTIAMKPVKKFEADWQIYKQAYEQFRMFRLTENVPDDVKVRASQPYTIEVSRFFEKRRPREAYYYYDRDRVYFFAAPTATGSYRIVNTLRELEEPVRFDLGFTDPISQEGMWQLAELVKDLPVTADHQKRLDYSAYTAFSKRMTEMLSKNSADQTLKDSPVWPLIANLQKFSERLDELAIVANSGAITPGADPSMSPAMAKKLLQELQNSESKFLAYFNLHTGGLDRSRMNQVAIMELWIDSRPSERLRSDWRRTMLPEVLDRLRYMTEEPLEYQEQRMAMLSMLVLSLHAISRDPL